MVCQVDAEFHLVHRPDTDFAAFFAGLVGASGFLPFSARDFIGQLRKLSLLNAVDPGCEAAFGFARLLR